MKPIAATSVTVVLALTAIVSGCALKHEPTGAAVEAVNGASDANDTESNVESMTTSFVGGSGSSGTVALSLNGNAELSGSGGIVAQTLGDAAKAFYEPAGCLTVTDDAAQSQATYAFADCTGPYGLVHITGTVTVTYSSSAANQLTLSYSATALDINNATIDWSASADVTANGAARTMVWTGMFSGTTGHGRPITRTNSKTYDWTVGVACLSVSGESDGTVTGNDLKVDIINWSRCADACPAAGSEIKITDVTKNIVYDLKYGDGDATYTDSNGDDITFTPLCAVL
jgi:hypothetical protein